MTIMERATALEGKARITRTRDLMDQPQTDFDGVAIMLVPRDEDLDMLAPFARVSKEHLHTTLSFHGDGQPWRDKGYTIEMLASALMYVAHRTDPLEAELGGMTRFSAKKGDDPIVLSVDSKGINALRDDVLHALGLIGVTEQTEHGYTPHMTLGYIKKRDRLDVPRWTPRPIIFDRIRVGFGGEEVDLPLGRNNTKAARYVRTPAGARRYGQPIGSLIVADQRIRVEGVPGFIDKADPNIDEDFDARNSWCYQHAAQYAIANSTRDGHELTLQHGFVQISPNIPAINHAWVELADGTAFEPNSGHRMTQEEFNEFFNPTYIGSYDTEEMRDLLTEKQHWGPFYEDPSPVDLVVERAMNIFIRLSRIVGKSAERNDITGKALRRVRTPEGADHYGQPIGSVIRRDHSTAKRAVLGVAATILAGMAAFGAGAQMGGMSPADIVDRPDAPEVVQVHNPGLDEVDAKPAPKTVAGYRKMFQKVDTDIWGAADVSISHEVTTPSGKNVRVWLYGDTFSKEHGIVASTAIVQDGGNLHVSHDGQQLLPDGKDIHKDGKTYDGIFWVESIQGTTDDGNLLITTMPIARGNENVWDFFRVVEKSRVAELSVTDAGDVNFEGWRGYIPRPALTIDGEDYSQDGEHHFTYQHFIHDIRVEGGWLKTNAQNWDDDLQNHIDPKTGELRYEDFRPQWSVVKSKDLPYVPNDLNLPEDQWQDFEEAVAEQLAQKHLPGQHNQLDHGRRGGKVPLSALAKLAMEGGFTWDLSKSESPTQGYVVALQGSSIRPATSKEDVKAQLKEFLSGEQRSEYVGGWFDREHNEICLDWVQVVPDRAHAVKLGREQNQQAIFDLNNFEEIDTGGDGDRDVKVQRDQGARELGLDVGARARRLAGLGSGPTDVKVDRYVRTAAGMRRYGQPIGSLITADPDVGDPELPLGLPDPFAGASRMDRVRVANKLPVADVHKRVLAMKRRWESIMDMDMDDWRTQQDEVEKFNKEFNLSLDGDGWKDLPSQLAEGPWTHWNPCRQIRNRAWMLLGYDTSFPNETRSDPSLGYWTPGGDGYGDDDYELTAAALLDGIHEAIPEQRTYYRGVKVSDPDGFIEGLRRHETFDLPLASFTDYRPHTERFGTDVLFALQRGSKGIKGGSMGPPPGMEEDHPDYYDFLEDEDNFYEYVTGGRFKIMRVYKTDKGYTVVIKQQGTFDPRNGLVKGRKPMIPEFDWVFDFPLAPPKEQPEAKDVYGGMNGTNLGRRVKKEKPVQRAKRIKVRALLVSMARNSTSLQGKALPKDGDGDGYIYDGTAKQRPAPVGTPVVGDLTYGGTYPAAGVPARTFQVVEDKHGDRYVVGPDMDLDDDLRFVAVVEQADIENFWDDIAVQDAASRVEALKLLDAITRSKRKAGAKTIIGSKGDNPTKINIPKRSTRERAEDIARTRAAQQAAKKKPSPAAKPAAKPAAAKKPAAAAKPSVAKRASTAAKRASKPAVAKPKAPKKVPAWQRDWNDLTKQEQKDIIAKRGVPAAKNPLTKQPWTQEGIDTKRKSNLNKGEKTLDDVVKRVQKNGWRLVTDDRERWGLSMKVGKSMPPNWSHVFVYEGPGADDRQYTVQGIDWAWKVQPHQPPEKREKSLGNKMGRYRALTKKLPALDRQTKKDIVQKKDPVAAAVRLLMLSGGRVDSGGGENVTGSRGITSLQARDVIIKGNNISLNFDAKSGHKNDYKITDKPLAEELQVLLDGKAPTDRLFPKTVNSGSTGKYLKSVVGEEFTNHDLRTAVANIAANKAIGEWIRGGGVVHLDNEKSIRTEVMSIAARVGQLINDTPGTAYNSYIDPAVFSQMGIPENLLPKRGAK